MADELPDPEERMEQLLKALSSAYALASKHLQELPLPIGLPPMEEDAWDLVTAITAMDRARTVLLNEEPIDPMPRDFLRRLLTEWLVAWDLWAFTKIAGPAPWRLEGIELAVRRIIQISGLLDLDIDLDAEDDESSEE
ncbi:hypothetical protein [Actinoallomurus sp. CA-142502]|uniref:hypothetical protein n=1 Tax=Actinoallomurus sp. CA-142502 TaxID=3239885 RepID=UPI003D8A7D8D